MSGTTHINVACPYCKLLNKIWCIKGEEMRVVVDCDTEKGGCGKPFVFEAQWQSTWKVSRIQGVRK